MLTTDESSPYHPIHFFKIHINIILKTTEMSSMWSLVFHFPIKILQAFVFSPIRTTCPAHHLTLPELIN